MELWTIECREYPGERIDVWLARYGSLSRNALQRLIIQDAVTVDGRVARKNHRVSPGETIVVALPDPVAAKALAEDIPLNVVYEDRDLIVIDKPRGLAVHPSPGHESATLVNALLHHCGCELSGIGGVTRPGIVHRLDMDTSGLLVCAKNDLAHVALSEALKAREIARIYECVVRGGFKDEAFTLNYPLGRHPAHRKKQAVLPQGGRDAVTHVRVLERFAGFSYVQCELETGRTHQIRVHLAHVGHPVAGDRLYGDGRDPLALDGQCLHARFLRFAHPRTGEPMAFEAPLPPYFERTLATLRARA